MGYHGLTRSDPEWVFWCKTHEKPTLGSEWAQWVNPSKTRTGPGRARYLGAGENDDYDCKPCKRSIYVSRSSRDYVVKHVEMSSF